MSGPTVLLILDGWGLRDSEDHNAVALGKTPNFDRLWSECPHATLTTFGLAVGLPEGQMGNSEVGHMNIGAGRVVFQELPRINNAIEDGTLARLIADSGIVGRLKESGGACHLAGLVSNGGVHSHMDHGIAIAKILAEQGIKVALHAFTDGRDTPPNSASGFLERMEAELPEGASVATVSGRYFAMDRDKRWDRVAKAYDAMVSAKGETAETAQAALAQAVSDGQTDEFVVPTVIGGYEGMADGDALICFNFRSDRVREILSALTDPGFDGFERKKTIDFVSMIGMVNYGGGVEKRVEPLFAPQSIDDGLSETLSKAGLKQMHMAETEKYPHVTYFLNGGREEPFEGEERHMVPSPKVATYDLKPEMSAPELTAKVLEFLKAKTYDFFVVNYANPDMVGHTGDLDAAIKAVETVDEGLGAIAAEVEAQDGALLVIADHGNCEQMLDEETGGPHTAHTVNPVPVVLMGGKAERLADGVLADVAPTLLEVMGLEKPEAMTGRSLIETG